MRRIDNDIACAALLELSAELTECALARSPVDWIDLSVTSSTPAAGEI